MKKSFPLPLRAEAPPDHPHADDPDDSPAALLRRHRSTNRPVVLIGFVRQGNLGIGYLSAMLRRYGYTVHAIDIEDEPRAIVERVLGVQPLLVGFSLIFQFFVLRFADLAQALRDAGVASHFTMGGHFPSLASEPTMALVPQLDSVVRFEGEWTLLELADRLSTGVEWRMVPGIVWRADDGALRDNPLRHLSHDLDALPWPIRETPPRQILGQRAATLVASRGCARTCSFCSIHTFYRAAPGKVVRTRDPARVVEEMSSLHHDHGINIFLFQDDDFPVVGAAWRRWTERLLTELERAELIGRIAWKINCRADAVEPELFARMRDAGLYLVYMGLESGSEEGLRTLGKDMEVAENLRAVHLLKAMGLRFEFGFMMFDPSTSLQSIRDNTDFLEQISGDGSVAAAFCRMVPYDGTPIKDQLAREGRLRGDVCSPDYDFLDPRIDAIYTELTELVHVAGWEHAHRALSPSLNWAWNEVAVMQRLFPALRGMRAYERRLGAITRASNLLLFQVVRDLVDAHERQREHGWSAEALQSRCDALGQQLTQARDNFVTRHQDALLASLQARGLLSEAA